MKHTLYHYCPPGKELGGKNETTKAKIDTIRPTTATNNLTPLPPGNIKCTFLIRLLANQMHIANKQHEVAT